jgi:hypothetical protein
VSTTKRKSGDSLPGWFVAIQKIPYTKRVPFKRWTVGVCGWLKFDGKAIGQIGYAESLARQLNRARFVFVFSKERVKL